VLLFQIFGWLQFEILPPLNGSHEDKEFVQVIAVNKQNHISDKHLKNLLLTILSY
jgi:hypothetical protein